MPALLTAAVLLLSGAITTNAGYMTGIVHHVNVDPASHSLKLSDHVIQNQVRGVITFFTEFYSQIIIVLYSVILLIYSKY